MSNISNTIRIANENYFPQLIELFKEFALFEKVPHMMQNSVVQMTAEQEYFKCFVAETVDKEIIGFAFCFFSYHTWTGKSLFMDDLYVKEKHRNQGIGKQLLETVIAFARKENCKKVRWQVSNWNKNGQDFYKKIGGEIDETHLDCSYILI